MGGVKVIDQERENLGRKWRGSLQTAVEQVVMNGATIVSQGKFL